MKILAIICEFNPFHNGHEYLIRKVKALGYDAVLCIMSGDFTQRGEICILDKYVRAKHAVLGGADCVIQLPAPFAVAPAEIFAKGAIKILSAIPDVCALAFGSESGNAEDFISAAKLLCNETELFKTVLSDSLNSGESYVKSYAAAFARCGGDSRLVSNPNNVLGLEYTKAIARQNSGIKIIPVKRIGSGFNDDKLQGNYSSASAIRKNLGKVEIKSNLPDYVYSDLDYSDRESGYESMLRNCLFKASADALRRVYGCAEGLENRLKKLENRTFDEIIQNATSKRYSSSRIKRILCANALELYGDDSERFLCADLYIKPLAIAKGRADEMLSSLSRSRYPLVCGIDTQKLSPEAKQCFELDAKEFELYNFLTNSHNKDYMITV